MARTLKWLPRPRLHLSGPLPMILAPFCLSLLLVFLFLLAQPSPGPGALQRIGWQSWDVIAQSLSGGSASSGSAATSDQDLATGDINQGGGSGKKPWWNASTPTNALDGLDTASLPLDVWDPILPHDTGLSELTVTKCYIDPEFFPSLADSICTPATTKEEEASRGRWVRVERDLLGRESWDLGTMNIYYRRTRRHDIPLVTDIVVLPAPETPSPFSSAWQRISTPMPGNRYLWYKAEKTLAQMSSRERQEDLITEVDVLYGNGPEWYGFERVQDKAVEGNKARGGEDVWLTIRRGVKPPPRAPPLHFSADGRFKIMQIADLHFSVAPGVCRDTPEPCDASDALTGTLLGRMLDAERPDLVVFTGDQLNGQGTTWDVRSVLAKFAQGAMQRGIPWAAVFGNHDDEDGESRSAQMRWMQALPYSIAQPGPADLHGVGNYLLKVRSADASATHLLTLYLLDSGSYSRGIIDWFGFFTPTEYDWIHQDQIEWFLEQSASIDPIERPFSPDTGDDFGDLWKRQSAEQLAPGVRRLAKPNALMFFHIPLQEAYAKADTDPRTGLPLDIGLHDLEENGASKKQDGFFHKGVLQALEADHRAGGGAPEVKAIANGHCHVTENCRRVQGVWMCFGGGGSYSGYGRPGFDRRVRIYDVSDYGETVRTWKRTEQDEIVDEMVLAGKGAPPMFTG